MGFVVTMDSKKRTWLASMLKIAGSAGFLWMFGKQVIPGVISTSFAKAAPQPLMIDLSTIAEGDTSTITWNNTPIFVRHRTEAEARDMQNYSTLKDPQADSARAKDPAG